MNSKGKKLERDNTDVWIAGVVSGAAHYFDIDVTTLRFIVVVGFILTGLFPGVFIYIAAWIMIPKHTDIKIHDIEAN